MWPFNRKKKQDSTVSEEVKEYYQTQKRERRGVALLLGAGTLVATVLVALGLFYGGRWLYQAAFQDSNSDTAAQNEQQSNENEEQRAEQGQNEEDRQENQPQSPAEVGLPAPDTNGSDNENNQPNTTTANSDSGNNSASGQQPERTPSPNPITPRTGPLPSTGPSEPEV